MAVAVVAVVVAAWLVGSHMNSASDRKTAGAYIAESCGDIGQIILNPTMDNREANKKVSSAVQAAKSAAVTDGKYGPFYEGLLRVRTDLDAGDVAGAVPILERLDPTCG